MFLNSDGTVKSHQKIDDTEGGFTGNVDDLDYFGSSVASLGDLDGDTVSDIVVGARGCDDGGITRGAVWVLFLNSDGTVKSHQKISDTQGGFAGTLDDHDEFGSSSASLADLNGDGVDDIAVGTPYDDDGGDRRGAVWVLFLNSDGTVKSHQKISDTEGGFTGTLDDADWYGWSVASLGDLNGDNMDDIAVGAIADDDGGSNQGAVWVLFLDGEVPTQLALDIKPELCPNSLNIKIFDMEPPPNAKSSKGGVLPVAVLGGDVSEIDVSSVHLEGVAPVRHSYEDVAAPVQDGEECECTTAGPDGYTDLTLKFEKSEIAAALGPVSHGDVIPLTLTGELLDGTPFEVTDCVSILHKDLGPPTPLFSEDDRIVLRRPVPNPFNPVTRISYVLPGEDFVRLSVYDVSGKLVDQLVARTQPAGEHIIEWDAKDLPSGIYFCRIQVGNLTEARKMILLK